MAYAETGARDMVTRLANANEAGARHLARLGGLSEAR